MTSPPGMVVLVFVSGKVVVTGAKSKSTIEEALNFLYPVLRDYRKT
jgi:transcription initiation factor TFIID TATA-box-binding protein